MNPREISVGERYAVRADVAGLVPGLNGPQVLECVGHNEPIGPEWATQWDRWWTAPTTFFFALPASATGGVEVAVRVEDVFPTGDLESLRATWEAQTEGWQ